MEHPLVNSSNRTSLISFIFRSSLNTQFPADILQMIVLYSQWIISWKPEWSETEDYIHLSGRIKAKDGVISSYHWRNSGGEVVSLNTLPTFEDNINGQYGDYIEWKVDFHRMAHCHQWFGVVTKPQEHRYNWNKQSYRFGIDAKFGYYNSLWIDGEPPDNEYWYKPPKIMQAPNETWKTATAEIETYSFKYDINEQTLTVYDPNMKKLGNKSVDYTWSLDMADKWYISAECHSVKCKITYKFVKRN